MCSCAGSCGGTTFIRSRDNLTSPGYPNGYPPNLHCQWVITAEDGQRVQINLTHIDLEQGHDLLYLYDGHYCSDTALLAILTGGRYCMELGGSHTNYLVHVLIPGNQGDVRLSYQSSGKALTLVLKTDVTVDAVGFHAIYTKLYDGTDLKGR